MKSEELADIFATKLRERPYLFSEIMEAFPDLEYRTFLLGWSELRTRYSLARDEEGRYKMPENKNQ